MPDIWNNTGLPEVLLGQRFVLMPKTKIDMNEGLRPISRMRMWRLNVACFHMQG